jgi:hypothetical protein
MRGKDWEPLLLMRQWFFSFHEKGEYFSIICPSSLHKLIQNTMKWRIHFEKDEKMVSGCKHFDACD